MAGIVFKVDTNYSSWRRKWQPTPVFLPGKFHGQRNLAGYSPWGHKESATTEHISTNYSSLSLPYVYAACHILGTAAVFIIYFYIDDSVERGRPFQLSSVTQSCPTLCNPMNCSTPGLPVYHQLLEFTQTHVHRVGDAIQPSHPLSSPSSPAPNPSQHQSFFQ